MVRNDSAFRMLSLTGFIFLKIVYYKTVQFKGVSNMCPGNNKVLGAEINSLIGKW